MAGVRPEIDTVVFDVGNVLLDWDPRYLYAQIFADPARMDWFLAEVCPPEWNIAQDGGRPWPEAEAEAIARHPDQAQTIRAFRSRWHEMVRGPIAGSITLLEDLATAGTPLFAITNFAADTFAETRQRHPFFQHFHGIVVSGEIKLMKPDARIYHRLADDHGVDLTRSVFIDDSAKNCAGARAVGMQAIHFSDAASARAEIEALGFLGRRERKR